MKRIFKTRYFHKWTHKADIRNEELCLALEEVERGLVDAVLGGGLIKKRIALPGKGKRGGARVILVGDRTEKWFFLYGFMKNERENIVPEELDALITIAKDLMHLSTKQLNLAVQQGTLVEIK